MKNFRHIGYWFIMLTVILISFTVSCSDISSTDKKNRSDDYPGKSDNSSFTDRYDPSVVITTVREVASDYRFENGDTLDDNIWYRAYENELGIKLENMWTATSDQYEEKFNVSVASGILPDVFTVNLTNFSLLAENRLIADLEDVFDKYASPLTRAILLKDDGLTLSTGEFGGRLMGIPFSTSTLDDTQLMWIRTDWLEKLGIQEPDTMQEVLEIAKAFTFNDPDGNGKADTYGLAANKEAFDRCTGIADLAGFFNAYHAYPNIWIRDEDGKLAYGSVQPEMKPALEELRKMYMSGIIDSEFGVKDSTEEGKLIIDGRIGICFGAMWNPIYPFQSGRDIDHKMQWKSFAIPSTGYKPAKGQTKLGVWGWHVVSKSCSHPEAVIKLINLYTEKLYGSRAEPYKYLNTPSGTEIYKYAICHVDPIDKNLQAHISIIDALDKNGPSGLNNEQKGYYDKISAFRNDDDKGWGMEYVFGPSGSQSVLRKINDNKLFLIDEFYGPPTPSMTDKQATLIKMQTEAFMKIVMGTVPVDEFDRFTLQWKALGGNDITREVNEWFTSR